MTTHTFPSFTVIMIIVTLAKMYILFSHKGIKVFTDACIIPLSQ